MKELQGWCVAMLAGCAAVSVGCSSITAHSTTPEPLPYAGTKLAIAKTKKYWSEYDLAGQVVFFAMDVPLCLIADTVTWPVDAYRIAHE